MNEPCIIVSESESQIVVGFPFCYMAQTSPLTFYHNGTIYKRGLLTTIPEHLWTSVGSCREYNL